MNICKVHLLTPKRPTDSGLRLLCDQTIDDLVVILMHERVVRLCCEHNWDLDALDSNTPLLTNIK